MNFLAEMRLNAVDWGALRALSHSGTAEAVPDAVRALAAAATPEEAKAAYWRLDNCVVVQGSLFEAGPPLVPVLLALLFDGLSRAARADVVEPLTQVCWYGTDHSEVEVGNADLEQVSRAHLRDGKWVLYQLLFDDHALTRDAALGLLECVETDREHLANVCAAMAARDTDQQVVVTATEMLNEIRGAG